MSKTISKSTLETIRARLDIVDIIGASLALKRTGSTFKALCPFHKEKTPSFLVNPHRQIFHCFGCGAGGDIFSFIMQHEGMSFVDAAVMLADRAGVALDLDERDEETGVDKNALYRLNADAASFYYRTLLENPRAAAAREYLNRRHLNSDTLESFQIGYAPPDWDSVLKGASQKGYSTEQLEAAGLVLKSEKTGRVYDRFRNRIMFPISDEQGRIIGFSGRTLEQDKTTAKYVNSPETVLFKKSRVLFGMHRARRAILDQREALVCEGQIDVIRCHQEGLACAVASQGTAFTEDHARILQRYADSICLAFDPDKAGQDAAIRAARVFLEARLAVRVVELPTGEDTDSFISQHGVAAFQAYVDRARSAIGYEASILAAREDIHSEAGLLRTSRALLETVACSPDAVHREKLLQETSDILNIPVSALRENLRTTLYKKSGIVRLNQEAPPPPRRSEARPREEVELCEHAVHAVDNPEVCALIKRYVPWDAVVDPACRSVLEATQEAARAACPVEAALFKRADESGEFQRFFSGLLARPPKVTTGRELSQLDAVKDLILRLWRNKLGRERQVLAEQGDRERLTQITYDLYHLKNWADGVDIMDLERTRAPDVPDDTRI